MKIEQAMNLKPGDRVSFNDGRGAALGVVTYTDKTGMMVEFVDRASPSRIQFSSPEWMNHLEAACMTTRKNETVEQIARQKFGVETFSSQLAATRGQLDKLEALAAKAPDLLEHGDHGIYVQYDKVRVVICDSSRKPDFWRELALKYRDAKWRRDGDGNWDGELGGVELTIIDAEPERKPSQFVFAEAAP